MKRSNERQITKDDEEQEDWEEEPGQFFKASVVDLSKRRIRKVKRTPPSTEGGANPFLGVTLMPGSKEEKAEEVKQAEVEKPCEESADPEPKTTAVEDPPEAVKEDTKGHGTPVSKASDPIKNAVDTPKPAGGFAGFAGGTSPFKQLSQDSAVTGGVSPAVRCSQESVATPVVTRPTVTPCPSAPLRGSSARVMELSAPDAKNGIGSDGGSLGGVSAFRRLAEGASIFTAQQPSFSTFGSPGFAGNGAGNGGGAASKGLSWQATDKPSAQIGVIGLQNKNDGLTEVAKVTGEENEETIFSHEATMFALEDGKWKHRGEGDLRVNAQKDAGTARLLLRQKATLRLFLNAYIYKSMKMSRMGTDSVTFSCVNGAEEAAATDSNQPSGGGLKVYAIRFPVKGESANMLLTQFEKVLKDFQASSNLE